MGSCGISSHDEFVLSSCSLLSIDDDAYDIPKRSTPFRAWYLADEHRVWVFGVMAGSDESKDEELKSGTECGGGDEC